MFGRRRRIRRDGNWLDSPNSDDDEEDGYKYEDEDEDATEADDATALAEIQEALND